MPTINTNLYSQSIQNYSRLHQLQFARQTERLSNGTKLNRGADDPSGLGMSVNMQAQTRGITQDIQNAQDGINLIRCADGFLDDVHSSLITMRDLTIRLSNEAVNDAKPGATQSDVYKGTPYELYKEILNLGDHIYKSVRNFDDNFNPAEPLANYNNKQLFQGEYDSPGQSLQIGPDNNVNHRLQVIIKDLTPILQDLPVPYDDVSSIDGRMNAHDYMTLGNNLLQEMDGKIDFISDTRAQLGVQDQILQKAIGDLTAQYTNMSASNSRIKDSDMSEEIVDYSKNLIVMQSTDAVSQQANAEPLSVTKLLGALSFGVQSIFNTNQKSA